MVSRRLSIALFICTSSALISVTHTSESEPEPSFEVSREEVRCPSDVAAEAVPGVLDESSCCCSPESPSDEPSDEPFEPKLVPEPWLLLIDPSWEGALPGRWPLPEWRDDPPPPSAG